VEHAVDATRAGRAEARGWLSASSHGCDRPRIGQPHLLFVDPGDGARPARLDYATRDSSGWSLQVVAEDRHDTSCAQLPRAPDERSPVAELASGSGDVRLLYSRGERVLEFQAKWGSASCSSNCGKDGCFWSPINEYNMDAVRIAGPISARLDEMDVISGLNFEAASAAVDGRGAIHVVGTRGRRVCYFSIITAS
jgi:hypothetical protein